MRPETGGDQSPGVERKAPAPRRAGRMRLHLKIRAWFLTGLVVAAPIAITVYLTVAVINFVDQLVARMVPGGAQLPFTIPGLGVLVMFIALVMLGAFTANVAGRWLIGIGERIVGRMPVVRNIYHGLKQIFETVLAQSDQSFKQVALIEYPRRGVWALAFVAGPTRGEVLARANEELLSLFLPTTPNPTSGFLLFVPSRDVIILDMSVEEGAKLVISGGLVSPPFSPAPHGQPPETRRSEGPPRSHPSTDAPPRARTGL